jgi:hypothetical protein
MVGSALDLNSLLNDASPSSTSILMYRSSANDAPVWAPGADTISIAGSPHDLTTQTTPVAIHSSDLGLAEQLTALGAARSAGAVITKTPAVHSSTVSGVPNSHSVTFSPPVAAAPHATDFAVTSLTAAAAAQAVTDAHWISVPGDGGINPLFNVNASSYLGGPGPDSMSKVAIDSNGNVYVAGSVREPGDPTKTDLAVFELDSNLANLVGQAFLMPPNSGDSAIATGLAIDSHNVVYVTGTVTSNGANSLIAARFSSLSGPDWTTSWTYGDPTNPASAGGCRVDGTDSSLYVTGIVDMSSDGGSPGALIAARLTDLASPSPTLDSGWGGAFGFSDNSGNWTPVRGNDIVPVGSNAADVAATLTRGSSKIGFAVNTDGTESGTQGVTFDNAGPNGALTGVAVDDLGNAYYTGAVYIGAETATRALIAKIGPGGSMADIVYAWDFEAHTSVQSDWTQSGNVLIGNEPYTVGTIYDNASPPDGNATIAILHFRADDTSATVVDGQPYAGLPLLGGSQNDYGNGIAKTSSGNIVACGKTTSPDFYTTPGAYLTRYQGGPSDGWVASTQLS